LRIVDRSSVLGGVDTAPGELSVDNRRARGWLEGNTNLVGGDGALRVEVICDGGDQGARGLGEGSLGEVDGTNTVHLSVIVGRADRGKHTQEYRQHRRIQKPDILR